MPYNINFDKEWESEQWAIFQALLTSDLEELEETLNDAVVYARKQGWPLRSAANIERRLELCRRVLRERKSNG